MSAPLSGRVVWGVRWGRGGGGRRSGSRLVTRLRWEGPESPLTPPLSVD